MEYGGMAEGTREDKRIEMAAHFPSIHGGRSFKQSSAYTRWQPIFYPFTGAVVSKNPQHILG